MGYKIFVSYKYKDNNVYPLHGSRGLFSSAFDETTVRDYVDVLEEYFDHTDHIYKGESDDEDLSQLSDDTIWEKLKARIFDSSVTIVMISPNMRVPYRSERSQWIPWEISYSLRAQARRDRTSHANAILAVVLPDRSHCYNYFIRRASYHCKGCRCHTKIDPVFSIIRKNMNNKLLYGTSYFSRTEPYPISEDDSSYIPSVRWEDFIKDNKYYIDCAVNRRENINRYDICKEV